MLTVKLHRSERGRPRGYLLAAFGLATLIAARTASARVQGAAAREAVGKFCALEFGGAQDVEQRQGLVHFTGARVRELSKIMDGLSPYVFEWETEPLEVVDSYRVGRVTVTGKDAAAWVTYQVVARRVSWGGRIERIPKKPMTVQLRLGLYEDQWKVTDPPFPRVSKGFLSSSYRGIFEVPRGWYQKASPEQLIRLRNAIDTILLLDELK
jgi:hypothetical protein